MQRAHFLNVIVSEKAHNEITFTKQVSPCLQRPLVVFLDSLQQKLFKLQSCAMSEHVVKAICLSVSRNTDKSVLFGHLPEQLSRVFISCDKFRHFRGKFVCQTHNQQKSSVIVRKSRKQGLLEHFIDISAFIQKSAMLNIGFYIQIYCRHTAAHVILRIFKFQNIACAHTAQCVFQAAPKKLRVVRIDIYSYYDIILYFASLLHIPVYSRGLAISHRSHNAGELAL